MAAKDMTLVLYKNKTDLLQVVYTPDGEKREVVPNGTVELPKYWGDKHLHVLAPKKVSEPVSLGKGKTAFVPPQ